MYTMLHVSKGFCVYLANESNHVKSFSTIFLVTLRQHAEHLWLIRQSSFRTRVVFNDNAPLDAVLVIEQWLPLLVDDVFFFVFGYTALHMGNPF